MEPLHNGNTRFPRRRPELPAFCRTRRSISTSVQVKSLRQLHWLLWLVLTFQLSTVLLVLAAPVPHPLAATSGECAAAPVALQPSSSDPSPSDR